MHAILLTNTRTKSNVKYASVPKPFKVKEHAIVQVKYSGINHLDLLIATGKRSGPKKFPHVLGSEIVGIVDSIAENSREIKKGDMVSIYPWLYCGSCPQCKTGNTQICDSGGTIGRTSWGGYAEYVSVPTKNLIKIPKNISLQNIAAITLTGTTACHLLERAHIIDKSIILVTGATGGVGTLVVQLLQQKRCRIIVTTSSVDKITTLKKLGIHEVFDIQEFPQNIHAKYPSGMQYVIDIMGGDVWSGAVELLAKGGSMSFCSTTLDEPGMVQIGSAFSREINVYGSYGGTLKNLRQSIKLFKKGILRPSIDSIISLSEVPAALARLKNREVFGKILIKL